MVVFAVDLESLVGDIQPLNWDAIVVLKVIWSHCYRAAAMGSELCSCFQLAHIGLMQSICSNAAAEG
jgi:hypothetical protein